MRTYEALYIVNPELEDDDIQTVAKETEALVVKHEGAIVRSEVWGRRKLAYTVKKHSEGAYILLRFQATPEFIRRLEGYFKLNERVIRYLVVHFDDHMLKLEALQQKRKEEEVRSGGRGRDRDEQDDDDRGPRGRYGREDREDREDRGPRGRYGREDREDREDRGPRRGRRRDDDNADNNNDGEEKSNGSDDSKGDDEN